MKKVEKVMTKEEILARLKAPPKVKPKPKTQFEDVASYNLIMSEETEKMNAKKESAIKQSMEQQGIPITDDSGDRLTILTIKEKTGKYVFWNYKKASQRFICRFVERLIGDNIKGKDGKTNVKLKDPVLVIQVPDTVQLVFEK